MKTVCVRSCKTYPYLKRLATRPPSAGVRRAVHYSRIFSKVQKEEDIVASIETAFIR